MVNMGGYSGSPYMVIIMKVLYLIFFAFLAHMIAKSAEMKGHVYWKWWLYAFFMLPVCYYHILKLKPVSK